MKKYLSVDEINNNDKNFGTWEKIELDTSQKRYLLIKRVFDLVLSTFLLLLLSIPIIAIIIIQKLTSFREPAFFKQTRIGQYNNEFTIFKFRSMKVETPKYLATNCFPNDHEYITKFGSLLRKTSLDELPQIINVLKGEMSFIGPRPLIPQENLMHYARGGLGVYQVKPGITGLAQISGRDNISDESKLFFDCKYTKNISFKYDFHIFINSINYVLKRQGIKSMSPLRSFNKVEKEKISSQSNGI